MSALAHELKLNRLQQFPEAKNTFVERNNRELNFKPAKTFAAPDFLLDIAAAEH